MIRCPRPMLHSSRRDHLHATAKVKTQAVLVGHTAHGQFPICLATPCGSLQEIACNSRDPSRQTSACTTQNLQLTLDARLSTLDLCSTYCDGCDELTGEQALCLLDRASFTKTLWPETERGLPLGFFNIFWRTGKGFLQRRPNRDRCRTYHRVSAWHVNICTGSRLRARVRDAM